MATDNWLKLYGVWRDLIKCHAWAGLIAFATDHPSFTERTKRAIVEFGNVEDVVFMVEHYSLDLDYSWLLEAIVFFRKNDKQFISDCSFQLPNLKDHEREWLLTFTGV